MSGNTSIETQGAALLAEIIYRAGFDAAELKVTAAGPLGGVIHLPPGLDPSTFKVRDLGYMLKAYGLPYKIMAGPET